MRIKRAHLSNKAFLLASALVLIEGVLYVLIHSDGIGYNRELSYLSVIAAAGFSFASIGTREREDYFVALGMLITLVADLFLVVCEPQRKLAGVITFLFAEVVYFLYIHFRECKRLRKAHLYALISVGALALAAPPIVLGDSFDILALVSVAYYALLILNVVFSFLDKELLLFSIALVLLALCDLSIGLTEIANSYFDLEIESIVYKIINLDVNWAWIFYLPSLTLMPLFLLAKREKNKREVTNGR